MTEVLERAWRCRRSPSEWGAALAAAEAAATDAPSRAALAILRAQGARATGDLVRAWTLLDEAVHAAPRWRARAAALRGSLLFEREGPAASASALRSAIEALLRDGTASLLDLSVVRNDLGRALFHVDAFAEADDLFARAAEGLAEAGDRTGRAVSLTNRASVRSTLGDLEGALALYREALAATDDPRARALAWTNLAVVQERLGEDEHALHAAREAVRLGVDAAITVNAASQLAHLLMDRGEADEARAVVAAAEAAARGLAPAHLGPLAAAAARVHGPTTAAMAAIDAVLDAIPADVREQRIHLLVQRARLASAAGDPRRAVELLEPLLDGATGGRAEPYAAIGEVLGAALEALGEHARACAVYRRVAALRERQVEDEARWRVRQLNVLLRVDELERREAAAVATAAGTKAALVRSDRERRLLEEQLRHSQRLEATGRLAAAVAHDFNNVLTVVQVCLDAIEATGDRTPLRDARAAAERGAALARSLLASGRRAPVTLARVDPAHVVRDAASLVGRMRPDVRVRVETSAASRPVLADPTLVDQVVMNLCVNAMDAMPGGGPLDVRVADRDRAGVPGVRIEVEDSGTGIAPELLERIFEPFFTTKPPGIGTGLGLSTVHGIVHQLGGAIDVRSTVGAGSCFGVWLPARPPISEGAVAES